MSPVPAWCRCVDGACGTGGEDSPGSAPVAPLAGRTLASAAAPPPGGARAGCVAGRPVRWDTTAAPVPAVP
eukprot:3350605-Prymnesium_polylepis.1